MAAMRGSRIVHMTDGWVRGVLSEARPVDYRDKSTRGLTLRVQPSGVRVWSARYVFEGAQRRFRIGTYPEVGLAAARRRAEKVRGEALGGRDAHGEKVKLRMGETVAEVAGCWLASEDTRHWRPSSRAGFLIQLEKRILPRLGAMKLQAVRRAHVQGLLDTVHQLHTRNRTFETLRMLFAWAVKRGLLEASPCAGVEKLREARRTRVLTDEEIRAVVHAFDTTRLCGFVRLLFLTGVRRDEALALRWADVDTERGVWMIPNEREKTGKTRGEIRKVALCSDAIALLGELRRRNMARGLGRAAFVFPGPEGGRLDRNWPKGPVYVLKGLRENGTAPTRHKLSKPRPQLIPLDFRFHDVRRTVADRMLNDLGLSAYIVDVGVLGHSKPKMLGVYAPSVPLRELRAALERWAEELRRVLGRGGEARAEEAGG
jgi:integrase